MDKSSTEWMIEPLRRYAQFGGRARRAEYWWFVLFGAIVALIAAVFDAVLGLTPAGGSTGPIGGIVSLGLFIPQLSVSVRRLHDLDRSGWWIGAFLLAVPVAVIVGFGAGSILGDGGIAIAIGLVALPAFIYSIVLLVWFCSRGTVGPNRFGDDPLAALD